MKKIFKYILFSLGIVFFLNFSIKADYASESSAKKALNDEKKETAAYYCKYNLTGQNNGKYDVIVAISSDKKKVYADTKDSGEEPILNWIEDDEDWDDSADEIGFSAYKYYLESGCPPVVYKHGITINEEYLGDTSYGDYYYMITPKYYQKLKESFFYDKEEIDQVYISVIEDTDFGEVKNCKYSTHLYSHTGKDVFVDKEFTLKIAQNGRILNESEFKSKVSLSNESRMGYENSAICPNIFVCHIKNGTHVGDETYYDHMIYFGDYASDNRKSNLCLKFSCTNMEDDYCKPKAADANVCNLYTTFYTEIINHLDDYKLCGDDINCKNLVLSEYNTTKDLASSWCNQVFKSLRYTDSCLLRCLQLSIDIAEEEKRVGINQYLDNKCGLSAKFAQWIANIVRWGKYLIPVVVIVLGILDFIKAIAADKDDEMKKAQGRFVKRLIAAALIFIIPFIIEFVLGKLGFDSNGCGIIDL